MCNPNRKWVKDFAGIKTGNFVRIVVRTPDDILNLPIVGYHIMVEKDDIYSTGIITQLYRYGEILDIKIMPFHSGGLKASDGQVSVYISQFS